MERLIAFLYRLIRDDIVSGKIEKHMFELEKFPFDENFKYSNKDLAKYCKKLAKRLVN